MVQSALRTGVASLLVGDLSRSQPRADNSVVHVARSMRERRVLRGNNNKEIVTGAAIREVSTASFGTGVISPLPVKLEGEDKGSPLAKSMPLRLVGV